MAVSSRRQYIQVSDAIRKVRTSSNGSSNSSNGIDNRQWDLLVDELVKVYSRDNPAFNADRFRLDCAVHRGHGGKDAT